MLMPTTRISQGSSVARPRKPAIELPPYVNCVRVKGRPYYYCHPGRGTPSAKKPVRLPDDPREPEFWTAYRRAMNEPEPARNKKCFDYLIDAYFDSPEYHDLAAATQRDYRRYLEIVRATWGPLEVSGLLPSHVLALRDKHRTTPAAANSLLRTLSSVISWSVPRAYCTANPCEHVKKLKTGDGWAPWPWEMIELLEAEAPVWMWEAAGLALYTGQRQGDVLPMSRTAVKGGMIEVRQEKTGRLLVIPAHKRLLTLLGAIESRRERDAQDSERERPVSTVILTSSRGTPWTSDGFRASWRKAFCSQDGIPSPLAPIQEAGLVFHGLRKSSVVTLLEAGCTDAEVSSITGQSRQMVEHYAKQVNQRKLAASAILKWERLQNDCLQNGLQNAAGARDL